MNFVGNQYQIGYQTKGTESCSLKRNLADLSFSSFPFEIKGQESHGLLILDIFFTVKKCMWSGKRESV